MKHSKFITFSSLYLKSLFSDPTEHCDELNEKQQKIFESLEDNKEVIDHLDLLITDFEQQKVRMNPTVYINRAKSPMNKELIYLHARTFYPYPNGERKDIKIYLGRAEKYGNNLQNPQLKRDAVRKMKETLNRRHAEGSI